MSFERKDTIECPHDTRYYIELDADEIFPDDPGQGQPVRVVGPAIKDDNESSASFNCAIGEQELTSYKYCEPIPDAVYRWLLDCIDDVEEWFEEHSPK